MKRNMNRGSPIANLSQSKTVIPKTEDQDKFQSSQKLFKKK